MKEIDFRGIKIQLSDKVTKHQKNKPTDERFSDGTYEDLEINTMLPHIDGDSIVLNLGGSIGGLACVINNKMTTKSNMVVVEANPNLIESLENNRDINNLEFNVEHAAVSSVNKEVNFNFNGLSLSGSIFRKGWLEGNKWGEYNSLTMETITPMDIEKKYGLEFNTLSCDIEGEELNLLEDLFDYFKNFKIMVVEFHNYQNNSTQIRSKIEKKYSELFNVSNLGHSTKFIKK